MQETTAGVDAAEVAALKQIALEGASTASGKCRVRRWEIASGRRVRPPPAASSGWSRPT
ncbi:hypothetical protein [Halolamina pelagica]|uniref:hypothetical protein n=1 Tax=Halolamina pelagica TaxID=699431 RepID=UPI00373FCFA1